jgi:hypothetical protein
MQKHQMLSMMILMGRVKPKEATNIMNHPKCMKQIVNSFLMQFPKNLYEQTVAKVKSGP